MNAGRERIAAVVPVLLIVVGCAIGSAYAQIQWEGPRRTPVARPDSFTVSVGTPQVLDVLQNDSDVAENATVAIDQTATCGDAHVTENGRSIRFDPQSCPAGTQARFKYVIRQGAPVYGIVTVDIRPPPAPRPVADSARTAFGQPVDIDVLRNDLDVRADSQPVVVAQPQCGTVATTAQRQLRYDPQRCSGEVTFEYCLENTPTCARAGVRVAIDVPPPPEPVADAASTRVGEPVAIDVLQNDRRLPPPGAPLAVEIATPPTCGSVSVQDGRSVRFDPEACPPGKAEFRYCLRTSAGSCPAAGVVVTIDPAPRAASARCDIPQLGLKMIAVAGGRFASSQAPSGMRDILAARDADQFEVPDFCISAEPVSMALALQYARATATPLWSGGQPEPAPPISEGMAPANALDFRSATQLVAWIGQQVGRDLALPTVQEIVAAAWRVTAAPGSSDDDRRLNANFLAALRSTARFWTRTRAAGEAPEAYWTVGGPLLPEPGLPYAKIAREVDFTARSMMFFLVAR